MAATDVWGRPERPADRVELLGAIKLKLAKTTT